MIHMYSCIYGIKKHEVQKDSQEKVRRFQEEIEYIRCHWIDILKKGDPYYNKNLSLSKWNYSLRPLKGMELKEKENR